MNEQQAAEIREALKAKLASNGGKAFYISQHPPTEDTKQKMLEDGFVEFEYLSIDPEGIPEPEQAIAYIDSVYKQDHTAIVMLVVGATFRNVLEALELTCLARAANADMPYGEDEEKMFFLGIDWEEDENGIKRHEDGMMAGNLQFVAAPWFYQEENTGNIKSGPFLEKGEASDE